MIPINDSSSGSRRSTPRGTTYRRLVNILALVARGRILLSSRWGLERVVETDREDLVLALVDLATWDGCTTRLDRLVG